MTLRYTFKPLNPGEAAALRVPKTGSTKRAVPTPRLDSESVPKRAKLDGGKPAGASPYHDATPRSDLASALYDLQKQNQVGYPVGILLLCYRHP
jgi:hypothetical protein